MRGYVERMEMLATSMPEGQEPTHEQIMDSYFDDADNAEDDSNE